jgi:hypothetical protein
VAQGLIPDPPTSIPDTIAVEIFMKDASYCDSYHCYYYELLNGVYTWSYKSRITYTDPSTQAGPAIPVDGTIPPDAPTPYKPAYDYCDKYYCYVKLPSGFWQSMYRFGSELVAQQTVSSSAFYTRNYKYTLTDTSAISGTPVRL